MEDEPAKHDYIVLTGPWAFTIGVVAGIPQLAIRLVAPTWVAWIGYVVTLQALLLLFTVTRGFEKAQARVRQILGRP
jgi:hypothetical protein